MTEPPRVSPPPSGEPPWQPPVVSDEWSPVPDAGPPQGPLTPRPPTVPGPQPQWGSAQWGPALSPPHEPGATPPGNGWPGWMPQRRPTSVNSLLQQIFSTTFAAPRVFLGLVGVSWGAAAAPVALITWWLVSAEPTLDDPDDWASLAPVTAFVLIVFAQWTVMTGALSGLAARPLARLRAGSVPTIDDALRAGRRSLARLSGWTALLGLAVAAAFAPSIALLGLGIASDGIVLITGSLLLFLVALIPVTWLLVRTVFTAPAIVIDGLSVRDAIARSGSLSAERFWRTFGILAVMVVLAWVAMTTMMYPFDLLGSISGMWFDDGDARGTETVVAVIGTVVASMVVQPILTNVPAVLYDDARAEADPTPFFSGQGDR